MRSRIACNAALAALAAIIASASARAEPTAEERTVAEALFREAKKLMQRGKIPEACEKLAASYKIDAAGGTLINLAMCHEVEGKTATAWTEFNEALSVAKKQGRKDRQKAASEHIAALEARLSRVLITIPPSINAAGLALKIDGVAVEAAAIGTAIPVDPGDHAVTATAPQKKPWEAKISLREGQRVELILPALEAADAAAPPPPPPPAIRWQKPVGFAAIGAGAVLLGVGTFFGVRAMSMGTTVSTECPQNTCSAEGWTALGDGRAAANVANGTLIAGGVLAAAGTALVIVGFVAAPDATRAGRIPLEIAPAVGPGGAFVAARGAF